MVKSRTIQLIFQSIYIGISIIAVLASFGLFDMSFRWDFYIHFTNLSNYLCIVIMLRELYDTAKKTNDSYVKTCPLLKFIALLAIILTFIIYNFVLSAKRDIRASFTPGSITLHIMLPLLFVFDYILFYEHGKNKWYYPIISASFPVAYALFIFIHAAILKFDTSILSFDKSSPFIYPYFFLRLDKLGVSGVLKNIVIIFFGFIIFGYIVLILDEIIDKFVIKK